MRQWPPRTTASSGLHRPRQSRLPFIWEAGIEQVLEQRHQRGEEKNTRYIKQHMGVGYLPGYVGVASYQ